MTDIAKLVFFGLGGDTVYYSAGSRSYGYGTPDNPHAADKDIPDGTPVIDITIDGVDLRWIVKGPLVNVDLEDDAVESCPKVSSFMSDTLNKNFNGLPKLHDEVKKDTGRGPLDMVSIKEYVQGWIEHGARVGHYENNTIVWD